MLSNISLSLKSKILFLSLLILGTVKLEEMFASIKKFQISEYLGDFWNIIDLAHFSIMWFAWYLWLRQNMMAATIQNNMPRSFSILESPNPETRARLFLTNPKEEFKYLSIRQDLTSMSSNLEFYHVLISISGKVLRTDLHS